MRLLEMVNKGPFPIRNDVPIPPKDPDEIYVQKSLALMAEQNLSARVAARKIVKLYPEIRNTHTEPEQKAIRLARKMARILKNK